MCKWAGRAEAAAEVSAQVHAAFHQIQTGRPGCAVLEIAAGDLAAETTLDELARTGIPAASWPLGGGAVPLATAIPGPPQPSAEVIAAAAATLRAAVKPVIWCGAGASRAAEAVEALATLLGCGVMTSIQGKGSLSDHHPLALGSAGENTSNPHYNWIFRTSLRDKVCQSCAAPHCGLSSTSVMLCSRLAQVESLPRCAPLVAPLLCPRDFCACRSTSHPALQTLQLACSTFVGMRASA